MEMSRLKNRPKFVLLTGEVNRQMAMLIASGKGDGHIIKPPTSRLIKEKILQLMEA